MKKYTKDDHNVIWVASESDESARGTFEQPFIRISDAVKVANPGDTIVLKEGVYSENVTIQKSGSIDHPIRITANAGEEVIIFESCWYFYDASDLIVQNITFKDASDVAISIVGASKRNNFGSLKFINCGHEKKESCSFFLGGSGAQFNVIERCNFIINKKVSNIRIGIILTEGDYEGDMLNYNNVVRGNSFDGYYNSIVVGTRGLNDTQFGHVIEYNTIDNCSNNGITVKCGDTFIKENVVKNCKKNAVEVSLCEGIIIDGNRIENSSTGMRILGAGHSISNNCIINSSEQSLHACSASTSEELPAENLIIEHNTCIGNKLEEYSVAVRADDSTVCIVQDNIFYGLSNIFSFAESNHFVKDNIGWNNKNNDSNVKETDPLFTDVSASNFSTELDHGAKGWAVSSNEISKEFINSDFASKQPKLYEDATEGEVEDLLREIDQETLLKKSFFFNEDDENEGDDEFEN